MPKTDPDKEKKQRRDFLKQASDMLEEMKRQLMKEMQGRVKEETEGVAIGSRVPLGKQKSLAGIIRPIK